MPAPNPQALAFLHNRQSISSKMLGLPVPDRAALMPILQAAARSPDHGKLEPWRFIVLERPALQRLSALAAERAAALGLDEVQTGKGIAQYGNAGLIVVVVASPKASAKVPEIEQILSSGGVCLAMVNAALASGWGACWLTGWPAYDRGFVEQGLGLESREFVAGVIHIGTPVNLPPDRPRPDLATITTWTDA